MLTSSDVTSAGSSEITEVMATLGTKARAAARTLAIAPTLQKNRGLNAMAQSHACGNC